MILGCLLLVLVLNRYEFKTKVAALSPGRPAVVALADSAGLPEILNTVRL